MFENLRTPGILNYMDLPCDEEVTGSFGKYDDEKRKLG